MNGGPGSSIGEDDDIATVEETFDEETSSGGNVATSPGSSPLMPLQTPVTSKACADSSTTKTSPTTAAVASVQAALAALQAGQMSLNQVRSRNYPA